MKPINIPQERRDELEKLAASPEHLEAITATGLPEQSTAIQQLARRALGLAPEHDIADLEPPAQSELLFVMSTMRDTIFPRQPNDTIETI